MNILDKLNLNKNAVILATTFIFMMLFVFKDQYDSDEFVDKISSEVGYFISKDETNLEKQKLINKQDRFYNEHIKMSYINSKKLEISYNNKHYYSKLFGLTEYLLSKINYNNIKNITFDGHVIQIDSLFLYNIKMNKPLQNILYIDKKQDYQTLIIELK